jgi:hypothetical protein
MTDLNDTMNPSPLRCPSCGIGAEPAWDYCNGCGSELNPPDLSALPAPPTMAPTGPVEAIAAPHDAPSAGGARLWLDVSDDGDVAEDAEPVPAVERPRRITKRRVLAMAGVVTALVLVLAGVVTDHNVRDDLDDTRATLASTRQSLEATTADLGTRTNERDTATAALAKAQADLASTQSDLSNSQTRVSGQATQIANLKTCLDGVLQAAVYLTEEYYRAASAQLDAVQIPCRNARTSLG